MRRLSRPALGIAWLALLVATPFLLVRLGLPSLSQIHLAIELRYFSTPVVHGLIAVVGWLLWGWLGISVVLSALQLRGRRAGPTSHSFMPKALMPIVIQAATIVAMMIPKANAAAVSAPQTPTAVTAPPTTSSAPSLAGHAGLVATQDKSFSYLVQPGNNLFDIAVHLYGDGESWPKLWKANQAAITDPAELAPGTVLNVPSAGLIASAQSLLISNASAHSYVVKPGDTLWGIAQSQLGAGENWHKIWLINNHLGQPGDHVTDPNWITPGTVLSIPFEQSQPVVSQPPAVSQPGVVSQPASPAPKPIGSAGVTPSASLATQSRTADASINATVLGSVGSVSSSDSGLLLATALPGAGIWMGIRRRRRRHAVSLPPGRIAAPPKPDLREAEAASAAARQPLERVLDALEFLNTSLEQSTAPVNLLALALLVDPKRSVEIVFCNEALPSDPWIAVSPRCWRLPAEVEIPCARTPLGPGILPGLVCLGELDDKGVWVNLEALGGLQLQGPMAARKTWLASTAWELAMSPFATSQISILVHDIARQDWGTRVEFLAEPDELTSLLARAVLYSGHVEQGMAMPIAAARLGGACRERLTVAISPDDLEIAPAPGVVAIGCTKVGPVLDLVAATVQIEGLGTIKLAPKDATLNDVIAQALSALDDPLGVEPIQVKEVAAAFTPPAAPARKASVQIDLLGPLRITGLASPNRAVLTELLAVLTLRPEGISTDRLIEAIWPQGIAPSTKQARLSDLRRWLTQHLIEKAGSMSLASDVDCDWWQFRRLAQSSDFEDRLSALRLVRGEPLDGALKRWADGDYLRYSIQAEIARLGLEVGEQALADDKAEIAWQVAEIALAANLYDQRITRLAMRARSALGDPQGVRQMLSQAQNQLDDDEDLDPETDQVAADLLANHRHQQQEHR